MPAGCLTSQAVGEPGDEERKERTERSADTQTMEEIIVVLWCASPLAQHLSSLVWCRERARVQGRARLHGQPAHTSAGAAGQPGFQ